MRITQWKNLVAIYLGDVYYSDNAIKIIVETKVKDTMFFCIRDVSDGRPVGINIKGREPLAYKVENQTIFRQAINNLLQMVDEGKFEADPIAWNLYRKINNLPIIFDWSGNDIFNTKGDYIVIDDYTTDIDSMKDISKLEELIKIMEGVIKMIKVEVIEDFHLGRFNELRNIQRISRNKEGYLYVGDTFECTEEMYGYLTKTNAMGKAFVKHIEVIPEQKEEEVKEEKVEVKEIKPSIKKTPTKRTSKKSIAKK